MRRFFPCAPVAAVAVLSLTACSGNLERTFGLTRDAPDEFTVVTRAPLSMPPDYTLTPPQPGAARPQELTPQQQAEAALVPDAVLSNTPGPESPGQQALVNQAGPPAPPDIREKIAAEQGLDSPSRGLTSRLLFWRSAPPPGQAVDPVAESARLREDAALGQPPTVGNTPIIQDKKPKSGWFSWF